MITFSKIQTPQKRFTQIPPIIDFGHKYILYACDDPVGITYGSYAGKLELHLPNGKVIVFSLDELKRIQKKKLSAINLVKYGFSR